MMQQMRGQRLGSFMALLHWSPLAHSRVTVFLIRTLTSLLIMLSFNLQNALSWIISFMIVLSMGHSDQMQQSCWNSKTEYKLSPNSQIHLAKCNRYSSSEIWHRIASQCGWCPMAWVLQVYSSTKMICLEAVHFFE